MGAIGSRVAGAGLSAVFVFISGFWLSRSGKPYNGVVVTIHKLISLAAAFLLGTVIYPASRAVALQPIELTAVVVTGLAFLVTIISGGLLSTDKPMPGITSTMHKITPYLTALFAAVVLVLVLRR